AARAPFGRGEVAEAQVRWQDAYTHYKLAAALHETTDHLESHARMTWRLAKGDEAVAVNEKVLALVKAEFGEQSHDYATRFNNLGVNMAYQDRFTEARDLLEQALSICKATLAADHRDIAGNEQNLTAVIAKMA
ncbi:MAG: tetratricopeptide repeat protein, partial [Rhodobacterales bacterium]